MRAVIYSLISYGLQIQLTPLALQTPAGEASLQAWVTFPNAHTDQLRKLSNIAYLGHKADAFLGVLLPKPLLADIVRMGLAMYSEHQPFVKR